MPSGWASQVSRLKAFRPLSGHRHPLERALRLIEDPELRAGIQQLFRESQRLIDDGQVSLVVLAARRLACLYELLVRAGMSALDGAQVISDRFLELGTPKPESGVLILDDSVIVGTTLIRIHDDIKSRWSDVSIRTMAVVVDVDQRADFLLEPLSFKALYERNSPDVQVFSKNVVSTLYDAQIPFFSDFVSTDVLQIERNAWLDYLQDARWHVAEVTAPISDSADIRAFAQIPSEETRARFLTRVASPVAELIETFKVRSYVAVREGGLTVTLVPIALLAPCSPEELDECIEATPKSFQETFGSKWDTCSASIKHRIIQLYASVCTLAEALEIQSPLSDEARAEPLNIRQLELYFGDLAKSAIAALNSVIDEYHHSFGDEADPPLQLMLAEPKSSSLLGEADVRELLYNTRELLGYIGYPSQPEEGCFTYVGLTFSHAISSLFGFVDVHYESQQRQEIIGLGTRRNYYKWLKTGPGRILNQGFTYRELTESLLPECLDAGSWDRSAVSLAIDIGNDLGIIVPVTQYDDVNDVVYRCYRLGETAFMAKKPLVSVIQEESPDFDEMTLNVRRGYDGLMDVRPLEQALDDDAYVRESAYSKFLLAVSRAVPGSPVTKFEGRVTAVHDAQFEAVLRSPVDGRERFGSLNSEQVPIGERALIRPTAEFAWTVFERKGPGVKDRTSRIRFIRTPELDLERMQRLADSPKVRDLFSPDE